MKRFSVAIAMAFSLVFMVSGIAQAKVFQLGHVTAENADSNYQYFGLEFAKKVKEYTKGGIEIQVIGSGQLGGERDMIEGMQIGTIDMAIVGNFILGAFVPQTMVFDLPYVLPNYDIAMKALDDPNVIGRVNKALEGINVIPIAWGHGGFRHVFNSVRPIQNLSDLKGLKIRVPENPIYMSTFKALGANATPMAWGEVFTGLQQKTIDGAENAVSYILNERFYEASKYVSLTRHFFSPVPLIVSRQAWESLKPEEQEALARAAREAALLERDFARNNEKTILEELVKNGVAINDDVNIEEFRGAVKSVHDSYKDRIGAELMQAILSLQ